MTLKQDRLCEAIINPQNIKKPLCEIAKEVGYSDSVSTSRIYKEVRKSQIAKKIQKAYNPERIKADILKAEQDFAKDKDNSNRARMLELRAKILGLTKEQSNTQVSVFTGDMIKDLPPIDISQEKPSQEPSVDATTSNSKG